MDLTEQVTNWVENKMGKIIDLDLKENITDENSTFDVEIYVSNLLDKYFNEDDIKNLQEILNSDSQYDLYFQSEKSTEEQSTQESLESESNEFQTFSADDIIESLKSNSDEVKKKYLKILEASVEDLINLTSWNKIKEILQRILSNEDDREIINLTLKVFHKPLKCSKKAQIATKGFTTITEVIANQIDLYNLGHGPIGHKEIQQTDEKWHRKKSPQLRGLKNQKSVPAEVLVKLMWLLIDYQQQIPVKWLRFNEPRFREMIFSFIRLLSYSNSQNKKLSPLELLSVLNPKAGWCNYWCHTAVGRNLLCSALRKYKTFFIQVIEIILNHIKAKKSDRLPPIKDGFDLNKNSRKFAENENFDNPKGINPKQNERNIIINSAPVKTKTDLPKNYKFNETEKSTSEWIIENIPGEIVMEAVFFHSICFVSCLIQFRSGRALFPVQTTTRKRLLSVQDFSVSIIEYLENIEYSDWSRTGVSYTTASESKILEMLDILKRVKAHISSSRMSTERQRFPYI